MIVLRFTIEIRSRQRRRGKYRPSMTWDYQGSQRKGRRSVLKRR